MATLKLTTARVTKANGEVAIIIVLGHKGKTANIKTGLTASADKVKYKNGMLLINGDKATTSMAEREYMKAKTALYEIQAEQKIVISRADVAELRVYIVEKMNPAEEVKHDMETEKRNSFLSIYKEYLEQLNKGTKECYQNTLNRLMAFDVRLSNKSFDDIDIPYLKSFDKFLMETSKSANGRGIKFRNIRTIFNYAIDKGVTTNYPFRRRGFKIASEPTRSRALSIEQLRSILSAEKQEYQKKWADLFFIVFGLIGINMPDLANVKQIDEDGYIRYKRAKTHKLYTIKVEDEIRELIERNRGNEHLLSYFDVNKDYDQVSKQMSRALRKLGIDDRISAYYARHSWSSIALNDAGVSMDIISACLGHSSEMTGENVTQRYARTRQNTIDSANRKVLDLIFK